jgi:signal transduction histidine kinase
MVMMMIPWILCVVLLMIVIALCAKIISLKWSMDEICAEMTEYLSADTNTLITLSTRDKHAKHLADQINTQLRILRIQRQKYLNGDRELKEAVTNISHDLRTPLTAICGYLDLLEREEKSESVERYLSQIENRIEALKALTEELFRYSVVTSSQDLKLERLDMVRILEESLLSFYGVMQEKAIQPEISLPEGPIYRELDAAALNRIFSNIISNAIKYSDGDFSVTMKEDGRITFINTAKKLDTVTVGRLFDRFYTVEASRNSNGLGLSIAKLLTERMGGSIEAIYQSEQLHIRVKL